MASLTGTKIKNTYDSLLKTTDNEPLDGTLRTITDGLGNNSTLSLSTSAASVGGTLSVSGNATFDTNVYVGGVVANVDDLDTNISFGTNQISLITGGLTRLSASDASTQVTNPLIASSTLTVTGNYNSIFGDIALANGKIAVGGSVSIANSVGASLFSPNANLLVLGDTGAAANQGMTIVSPTGATGNIYFADGTTGDAEYRGSITYNHNVDTLYIGAAATNKLAISGTQSTFSGNVLVVGNLPSYTNSLYVDSTTNNVGIGTNNPQNSSGYAGLHLNGATGGVVKFMDDATVVSQVFGNNNEITIQAEGERDVVVKTNNSERLRIEDAGASVTGTLSVSGGITGTLSTAAQTNITSVGTLSSLAVSGNLTFDTNTLFVDAANNRVGVGTASPDSRLVVISPDNDGGTEVVKAVSNNLGQSLSLTYAGLKASSGGGIGFTVNNSTFAGSINSNGDISFRDSSANEAFYWDASAASLGIGVQNPSKKIHLYASNDTAGVRFTNTAANKVWDIVPSLPDVSNTGFSIYNVTDNNVPFHITDSGNVGIGVSPSAKLDARLSGTSSGAVIQVGNVGSGGFGGLGVSDGGTYPIQMWGSSIAFLSGSSTYASATEKVRILSSGGITFNGDTSSANALDDYEEGTWNPTVADASSGGNLATLSAGSYGAYTKIGNVVYFRFSVILSSKGSMSSGNDLWVRGFPYTSVPISGNWYNPSAVIIRNTTFSGYVQFNQVANSTVGYFRYNESGGTGGNILVSQTTDSSAMQVSGFYSIS